MTDFPWQSDEAIAERLAAARREGEQAAYSKMLDTALALVAASHRTHDAIEAKNRGLVAEIGELNARLRRLESLEAHWREHHEIVADVQQWFHGFAAAHAGRESWERPRVPDPRRLRLLNLALLSVDPSPQPEEVPF